MGEGYFLMKLISKSYIISYYSMPKSQLVIGYYPLRGKAQVCRLLCEYLGVPYEDKLYSLQEWDAYKKQKMGKNSGKELPYLQEGNFCVTGSIPMCLYIIDRFCKQELLGKTLKDQAIVDMYLWTIENIGGIINLNCQKKTQAEMESFKESQWNGVVAPRIQKYQECSQSNGTFMGYLTVVDFSIYELVRYMEMLFGPRMQFFPKLIAIRNAVGEIPAIKLYQNSPHAVSEMCPTSLLKQLKEDKAQINR